MSALRRLLPALPLLVLCACTTLQGRARDLVEKGEYVEAAGIYDELVQKHPQDKGLAATRDDLRQKALEQLLGRAKRYRLDEKDEEAEDFLTRFLDAHAAWGTRLNGALEDSLLDEIQATRAHLRRSVSGPAQRGLALVAEAELTRKHPLLAHRELGRLREELTLSVRQGGQATCGRLKGAKVEGAGVHWAELVSRYCRRFGQDAPEAPLAPELLGTPTWSGALSGASPEEGQALQSALARVFEASPWFSPAAPHAPALAVSGSMTVQDGREPVRLTAAYTESVPYTRHEEREEKRQVPYEKSESYTENGVAKTRMVTAYRPEVHRYTVPVTRYRDVPREFHYGAVRVWADYRFAGSVTGALAEGRAPLTVLVEDKRSEVGFEHDTRFPDAKLQPSRAKLTPPGDWFAQKRQALQEALGPQLVAAWREAYCGSAVFSVDEAARCARGGVEVPGPARDVLAATLGGDAAHAHRLYVPAP